MENGKAERIPRSESSLSFTNTDITSGEFPTISISNGTKQPDSRLLVMESSEPSSLRNASGDPTIATSSVVIDQTETDHQGRLMVLEGSSTGGIHDSSDEQISQNTSSVCLSHFQVGDSENNHVVSPREPSLHPIDVTKFAVGSIHGVSDGQQSKEGDSIVSFVINGDRDMILPSASPHDVSSSELTLPVHEVGTIVVGSIQDTSEEQQPQNAHSAPFGSKRNRHATPPSDPTQPCLMVTGIAVASNGISSSSLEVDDCTAGDAKNEDNAAPINGRILPYKKIISSTVGSPRSLSPKYMKQLDLSRVHIDTAAPFESVKEAVYKFEGIVDWKARRMKTMERHKLVEEQLEKLKEKMPEYKKRSKDIEEAKIQVLEELNCTKRLIEELKLSLERALTEENQAKQDSELAKLRAKELEQGIADEASVAAKAQLEVAKARHAAVVSELKSVKDELEALQKEYASLMTQREIAVKKAEDAVSASKMVEKTVEELTIELIATKESLESAHAMHLEAEERRIRAAMARDHDTHHCEKDIKQDGAELQGLNQQIISAEELRLKLDIASAMLLDLKAEFAAYKKSKLKEETDRHSNDESQTSEKRTQTDIQASISSATKKLEEAKLYIEKATAEVNGLKVTAISLKSELEKEKSALATITQRERIASVAEKMVEQPKQLQQAAQEVDKAKSLAQMAREELRKAKEEAEQAKAEASTMGSRLLAAQKEIEAAKASEKLALSAIKALQETESAQSTDNVDSSTGIMLSFEEYYELGKRAYEAEEDANMRVAAAIFEIEVAKQSKTRRLEKLEEVNREMAERKAALKIAMENADKANVGKATELSHGNFEPPLTAAPAKTLANQKAYTPGNNAETESSPEQKDVKKNKRSFFPRIFMIFARKKSDSSNSI